MRERRARAACTSGVRERRARAVCANGVRERERGRGRRCPWKSHRLLQIGEHDDKCAACSRNVCDALSGFAFLRTSVYRLPSFTPARRAAHRGGHSASSRSGVRLLPARIRKLPSPEGLGRPRQQLGDAAGGPSAELDIAKPDSELHK